MALAGRWKGLARQEYQGARVWGTGVNPIHASRDDGTGRVLDPANTYEPGSDDPGIDYGYCPEDMVTVGVNPEYTSAHPNWGDVDTRTSTHGYPRWGTDGNEYPYDPVGAPPMGTGIRSLMQGDPIRGDTPMQIPSETV